MKRGMRYVFSEAWERGILFANRTSAREGDCLCRQRTSTRGMGAWRRARSLARRGR